MSTPRALKRIAYHEAGHAVMHVLEHIPFRHVTIVPDEESSGHVHGNPQPKSFQPEWDNSTRMERRAEALVRIDFAGQVAEQILRGRKSWKQGSQCDLGNAVDMLCYLAGGGDTLDAYLHLLLLETRNILQQPWNWAMVEAVAAALLRRKTLSAREVRRLSKEASKALYAATVAA